MRTIRSLVTVAFLVAASAGVGWRVLAVLTAAPSQGGAARSLMNCDLAHYKGSPG